MKKVIVEIIGIMKPHTFEIFFLPFFCFFVEVHGINSVELELIAK